MDARIWRRAFSTKVPGTCSSPGQLRMPREGKQPHLGKQINSTILGK